jgi:hypothetical protein
VRRADSASEQFTKCGISRARRALAPFFVGNKSLCPTLLMNAFLRREKASQPHLLGICSVTVSYFRNSTRFVLAMCQQSA